MSAYSPSNGDVMRILLAAAERVELALKTESDRLAAPGDERSVEHGIGVLKAINAARKAVLAEGAYAPCPACGAAGSGNFDCVTCHQTWRAAWGHVCTICEEGS